MILHAIFTNNQSEVTTGELFQWDIGQQLCIEGLSGIDENTEVHFANNRMIQAIVKTGTFEDNALTVDIPNEFLQSGGVIHGKAWVYVTESETVGQTIKTINIPIVPRTRPNDYVSPADPDSKGIVEQALEILRDGTKVSYVTTETVDNATADGTIYYTDVGSSKALIIPVSGRSSQAQFRLDRDGKIYSRRREKQNGEFPPWGSFADISAGVDPEIIRQIVEDYVEDYIEEHGIADGKSAYEIAVEHGYEGTEAEWLESLHGADGAPGAKGDKGDKGETGAQGEPGANGKDGAKGDKGDKGDAGDKGERGIKGDSITAAYRDSVSKHLMLTRTVYDENGTASNTPIDVGAVNGRHGNSLQNVSINSNGELETTIRVYDDSNHYNDMIGNLGRVVGADGAKGDKGDKGDAGDDYVLTDADKTAIATEAAGMIDISGKADKSTTLAGYGITDGETTSHKVTAITSGANNTMYPSALAVYNALSGKESTSNKSTTIGSGSSDAQYPTAKAVYTAVSQREVKSNKVTEIGSNPTDTQYPSALAVKKAIDAANPYVFVTEIPQDADHSKKYVLPDGYIWEWREGSAGVPYNANTKLINQRPKLHTDKDTLESYSGVLVSDVIPFGRNWQYYSNDSIATISGINAIQPVYYSPLIVYYYRRDTGAYIGTLQSAQLSSMNYPPNDTPINLPANLKICDPAIAFSNVDVEDPGKDIGYVRILLGISTTGSITENDVKDIVINVPSYDAPGTSAGWVNTGQKHPDYISDNVFDVDADQVLYVVGDSIAYGYGGSGIRIDSWVKYAIEHNGYDAENSLNLSESGLGFCTTSTQSHTINDIVGGNSFSGADVVVVALGVNDWKNANATLTQLWSGMQYCFNKIRTDNPYCKIYYLLPFNVSFSGAYASFYGLGFKGDSDISKCYGHTLREFINLIKTKLSEASFKAFDIHVIDMVECAAINRNNITTALFDSLHPSAATQEVLGKEIARFIAQDRSVKDNSNYLTLDTLPIYNGGVQ